MRAKFHVLTRYPPPLSITFRDQGRLPGIKYGMLLFQILQKFVTWRCATDNSKDFGYTLSTKSLTKMSGV